MDITIHPLKLCGSISAIPSKSYAHRLLICGAFSDNETTLICPETSDDIEATVSCLNALGAQITRTPSGYTIVPIRALPESIVLHCGESGSTLRFLLPIVGALGVDATFCMEGQLAMRPLSPLWEEMERMGCKLTHPAQDTIRCCGKLSSGRFSIDGSVSSQFISGLLFAGMLMDGVTEIQITGTVESLPYIKITQNVLEQFGVSSENMIISGKQTLRSPGEITVEGDWSNSAFFLAANALGSCVEIQNLNDRSIQGDRTVVNLIRKLEKHCVISAKDIPDLVPVLAVVASGNKGAVFTETKRLQIKESNRVAAVAQMLHSLGGRVEYTEDTMTVYPTQLHTGTVDTFCDHRIAMAVAIAATVANGPVHIRNADCVSKSYPAFWDDYRKLGGDYEQYIR